MKESEYSYNHGIALLRVILCLSVVLFHLWADNAAMPLHSWIYYIPNNAVSIFVVIVFYFLSAALAGGWSSTYKKTAVPVVDSAGILGYRLLV